MQHEITIKINKEYNGTYWEIFINGVKTPLMIHDRKLAAYAFRVLKDSMNTVVEAISKELEK